MKGAVKSHVILTHLQVYLTTLEMVKSSCSVFCEKTQLSPTETATLCNGVGGAVASLATQSVIVPIDVVRAAVPVTSKETSHMYRPIHCYDCYHPHRDIWIAGTIQCTCVLSYHLKRGLVFLTQGLRGCRVHEEWISVWATCAAFPWQYERTKGIRLQPRSRVRDLFHTLMPFLSILHTGQPAASDGQ